VLEGGVVGERFLLWFQPVDGQRGPCGQRAGRAVQLLD